MEGLTIFVVIARHLPSEKPHHAANNQNLELQQKQIST
jgi:hypothetical protein